jgi:hypothetical protein
MFHEITVGATCTKRVTCKEQATEFFEEASALDIDAAIFDLKKQFLRSMCKWIVSANIAWFKLQMPEFRSFLGKVLQAKYSRPVNTSKIKSAYLL